MKAKKLIVFTLLAILLLSTFACGGGEEEEVAPTPEPGAYLVYEVDYSGIGDTTPELALAEMEEIIKERIYAHGFDQPVVIETEADDRISIFFPGAVDVEEAREMVGNVGQFNLREFVGGQWVIAKAMGPDEEVKPLTGAHLAKCSASSWTHGELSCDAKLEIRFEGPGVALLSRITQRNSGKTVGIFIGDAPLVQVQITEPGVNVLDIAPIGCGLAEYLAETINQAALPVSLRYIGGYVYPPSTELIEEPAPTPAEMPDFEYLSYTDEINGFSIWCPRDWYKKEAKDTDLALKCVSPTGNLINPGGAIIYFSDLWVEKAGPYTLGTLWAAFNAWKMGSEELEGYAEVSEERVTIVGESAVKHVFHYSGYAPEGTILWKVVEIFFVKGSFVYDVCCRVPSWGWDEYQSTFDTMISSFRLLE